MEMGLETSSSLIIALDGPAASGKGTLARRISDHYAFAYLDTGTLYRGVAWVMLDRGLDPGDAAAAADIAEGYDPIALSKADIRTAEVGAAASIVAKNGAVRAALLAFQQRFAGTPPGGVEGAVLDGRDIGTVVCPHADVKLFVMASARERARRRWLELKEKGENISLEEVYQDLLERDARDSGREDAPMVRAADAELLDTTHLSIDAAFAAARRIIDGAIRQCG